MSRGLGPLVIKTIEALLPREMDIQQQALALYNLAVLDLMLTEGIEKLARAPARRTDRCTLQIGPQPGGCSGFYSGQCLRLEDCPSADVPLQRDGSLRPGGW